MLYLDTETFNGEKDLSCGTYEYARTAEVLLLAYAFGDGPVQLWDRTATNAMPDDLQKALADPGQLLCAHNAMFDRTILKYALGVETEIRRWRCTMVKALVHGFAGSLERLGAILGLPAEKAKDKEGKRLIQRFCLPAPKNHKVKRYDRSTHPEEWARFCAYAIGDIEAMREINKRLPEWNLNPLELSIYHLDQTLNDRGFLVDREFVEAAVRSSGREKMRLSERFATLTEGKVASPTQRAAFQAYLNGRFQLNFTDTQAQTFKQRLQEDGLPPEARELLEISLQINKTSTAKYASLAQAISPDDRFRGGLQFSGAARTRRWSGRQFQPHNLPSKDLPGEQEIAHYIEAVKGEIEDLLFDTLTRYASAALRGVLIAGEGKTLAVADLSNIEGRMNAWLAGEAWKIAAFEAFDRGEGPDLYKVTAAILLGKAPEDVSKTERNILGKVPELALGYQGGVGAFQTFARAYGIKMSDHWGTIQKSLAPGFIAEAFLNYETFGHKQPEIDQAEWVASESVKLAWRARHPAISQLWKDCEAAARSALQYPGRPFKAGNLLRFKVTSHAWYAYLLGLLPSGNALVYFDPKIDEDGHLTYMGPEIGHGWARLKTYGGKLVENACQSLGPALRQHISMSLRKSDSEKRVFENLPFGCDEKTPWHCCHP